MRTITKSMCWDLVVIAKDRLDGVAAAIYRKPTDNECYERRLKNEPPMCSESDDPNAAWYIFFFFLVYMNSRVLVALYLFGDYLRLL